MNQENNTESVNLVPKSPRFLSIDIFRGLTIVAMIFVNAIGGFETIPAWSKHAVDYGLTYVDLVAPFFILAIGLTYKMAYDRNLKKEGILETFIRYLRRYAAFIGIGMIGGWMILTTEGIRYAWGVLQSIGLAGIFTLLFIRIRKNYRLVIAIIWMIIYQMLMGITFDIEGIAITFSDLAYNDVHGGFIGAFGWGILLLLGTVIFDDFSNINTRNLLYWGIFLIGFGLGIHLLWLYTGWPYGGGISKERVTNAYILVSLGIGVLIFYVCWWIYDYKKWIPGESKFLQPLGKNSFFLYILHGIVIGLPWLYLDGMANPVLVILSAILCILIVFLIGNWMDKKKFYIII
jgi:predicted acyltransferase